MTRKLKTLGLALVAVFAMSAVAASAASAAEFHSAAEVTELKGFQAAANVFTTNEGKNKVECSGAEFAGKVEGKTQPEVTVHPTYTGCTAFGLTTDITTTGCDYTLDADGSPNNLLCSTGNSIKLEPTLFGGVVCTVTVAAQALEGSIDFTNQEFHTEGETEVKTPKDVLVTSTVTGIDYTVDGGGGLCGTVGAHNDGVYHGTVTEKGFNNEGKQVDIFVE